MNTKGMKFLAVLAVLAMAFAAIAIIASADDTDAVVASANSDKWDPATQGPLDFDATLYDATYGTWSNKIMGNNILVSYDAASKTYTITGTLYKQALTGEASFAKLWPSNTKAYWGLAFGYKAVGGETISIGTGDLRGTSDVLVADAIEQCLLYLSGPTKGPVVIGAETYYIDATGVSCSSTAAVADSGYVAFPNANALAGASTVGNYTIQGTDGASGTWRLVQTNDNVTVSTLTLNNYKGFEYFDLSTITSVVLVGANTITITDQAANEVAGIKGSADMTVGSEAAASLTISNDSYQGYAFSVGSGSLTLGNAGDVRISFDLSGHNRALNVSKSVTIRNATVTATGGERCIAIQNQTIENGKLTLIKSVVTASLGPEVVDNGVGTNDRFAVKAGAIDVDADSTLTAMGLRIFAVGGYTNAGKINVDGAYVQNPVATLESQIAGFYCPGVFAETLTVYTQTPSAASYLLLQNDAKVYGNVKVVGSSATDKVQENVDGTNADISAAVASDETAKVINAVVDADIDDLNATLKEDKTLIMTTTGGAAITGVVKFADEPTKTITLTAVEGSITITKGSIRVEAAPWAAGSITIADDDEVKIFGTITGDDLIVYTGDKSPKIIVEKDETLTITGSLTIPANAVFEVYGKVIGTGALTLNGNMNVYDGAEVTLTTINANKPVVAKSGSLIAGTVVFGGTGKITAESGSDINGVVTANPEKLSGKDSSSGTWSYDVTGALNVLKLNGYNGTYNFKAFATDIKAFDLTGTNSISYVLPEEYNINETVLFGSANFTSITTATSGSVTITVDLSKVAGEELNDDLTVIQAGALSIDAVQVGITVTGTNNDWTADDIAAMVIYGIDSAGIDAYNADLDVDVMSTYTAAGVYGIYSTGVVQYRSCDDIVIASAGTGLRSTAGLTVKDTDLSVNAKELGIHTAGLTISNGADVSTLSEAWVTGAVVVSQESTLTVEGFIFSGATLTNDGTISVSGYSALGDAIGDVITNNATINVAGNLVIFGAVSNKNVFTNDGVIGLYGSFANSKTFNNNGTFTVLGKKVTLDPADDAITIADTAPAAGKVKITAVDITSIMPNADGTCDIVATVDITAGTVFKEGTNLFIGKLTLSQTTDGYTLAISNTTASFTITYDPEAAGDNEIGGKFTASVSGYIVADDDTTKYLDAYSVETTTPAVDGADVTPDVLVAKIGASGAAFTTTAGKVTSTGSFTIYSPATATIAGEFEGNIAVNIATKLNINGKFTGNITSDGAAEVAVTKKMVGDITAIGAVSSVEDLTGNIISGGDVTIEKKFDGNVTMKTAEKTFSVTGTATGTLTFTAEYKATKDATTKTASTATVDFATAATTGAVAIITVAGADATAETAMKEVSFKFGAINALGADKTASIKVTSGIFAVPENKALVAGYEFVIEAGATIEVAKVAQLDVTASALKVSKDAVKNFETGTGPAVTYGKVISIMSFDIDGGAYTIYSNVAYALSNCDENADISVLVSDTISEGVKVRKGVNVIVGDGVTLTFDGKNVEMESGAKISIVGTGKVVFNATGDNKAGLPAEDEYVYYTVSGTVVFGDNSIAFDGVRFSAAATLQGIAAADPAPAKISATLPYNQGTATLVSGNGIGILTLGHATYSVTKADEAVLPTPKVDTFAATFVIAEGTVFEANGLTDAAKQVDIVEKKVTNVDFEASKVTVSGTLKVLNNIIINGVYDGAGEIVLTAGKNIQLAATPVAAAANVNDRIVEAVVTAKIVDTTDAKNGYVLTEVSPVDTVALTFAAEKVATVDTVTIAGQFDTGKISALTTAQLKGLTVAKGAEFTADVVNVNVASKSDGVLKAKTMNMRTADVVDFAVLDYQATYVEDGYTVYTYFANIDLTKVSDVTIENDYNLPATIDKGNATITIKDGVTAHIAVNTVIGVAPTELGAGIVIKGTIMIDDDKFVIVYPGVDISGAKFVRYGAGGDSIVNSVFDIEGTTYATVYANKVNTHAEEVQFADAAALMNPQIKGYTFTKWVPYNGSEAELDQNIGVCNVTATLVAQKVLVKATFLEGVQYYCNGVLYDAVGIENKVTVGSIFTAKIVDYSKYQGTPLVNGKNAFEVTENVTLNVTGVSPVEPTPEPEPAGMSLTEILLIVLVVLIAIMVVIIALRLNRS